MHSGNGEMSDLGRRFVACFDAALDDAALPADPVFRQTMHDYLEWAVTRVLAHEDPGRIPDAVPVPRWSWDGPCEQPE